MKRKKKKQTEMSRGEPSHKACLGMPTGVCWCGLELLTAGGEIKSVFSRLRCAVVPSTFSTNQSTETHNEYRGPVGSVAGIRGSEGYGGKRVSNAASIDFHRWMGENKSVSSTAVCP